MDKLYDTIKNVKEEAKANFVPIVRDKTLQALLNACKENCAQTVLEIGTATGYSGLNILTVADTLTTIEKNEERFKEADDNFKRAEISSRVTQILGDAGQILETLASQDKQFDLVFLDGPKGQYQRYLPSITKLLKAYGVLFADNILLDGLLHDDSRVNHKNRAMVKNMRAFVEEIKLSKDFSTQIFEIEDGFAICKKQKI